MTDPDPSRVGTVASYRGDLPASELGWTLTHEHIFVLSPELDRDYPHPEWDRARAVETAVAGLEDLWELGIRTVVDLTVPGLGREVELVGEVSRRVRMNLIASTGWYCHDVLPTYFRTHGPGRLVGGADPLPEMFVRDIREGIAGTSVRAGMLKVVTDEAGMTPDVVRVMEAAAAAHVETGVPITTHSNPALRNGLEQLRFLIERGVDVQRVVIGHSGDSEDLDYLRELMADGATLGFDRFGMAHTGSDEARVRTLLALLSQGYADRIVLSHDSAYFSRVTPPSWRRVHAPSWTHDHLSRQIIPKLREQGVDDKELEQMMVTNPARLLIPTASQP